MEVYFKSVKLQKICNNENSLQAEYGMPNAKKIMMRLNEMKSVENLSRISTLPPPRRHILSGKRAGQFAVDIKQPFRIVFVPYYDTVPKLENGDTNVSKVTKIKIIWIGDYHGE